MSEEDSKPFANEDDDARHRREEAERRAKRKVRFRFEYIFMVIDVVSWS